jgi:auxin response factor
MGIDLNAVEGDAAVCGELWHACAGAGVALPRRGRAVVYLPQAHLAAAGGGEMPAGAPRVPPHVVCRVVDVQFCVSSLPVPLSTDLTFLGGQEGLGLLMMPMCVCV